MPKITLIQIDWEGKKIAYFDNIEGHFNVFRGLHFESLYDCLCCALSMGYVDVINSSKRTYLAWEK